MYRGEGSDTPSVAVLRSGDLVGTNIGGLSVAPNGAGWQPLATLGGADEWGTVPRVRAFGGEQALAVFARGRASQTPAYDVIAVDRAATGALTPTTLGTAFSTYSAVGLSMSVAADGQAIVTWPHASGGVDVVLRD